MYRIDRAATAAAVAVMFLVACGGGPDGSDENTGVDVPDAVVADVQADSMEDARPDSTPEDADEDGVTQDVIDVADDGAADVEQDAATDVTSDSVGPDVIQPACEGAIALIANTPYEAQGLDATAESRWADYSCDTEWSYSGPERVFSYTAPCEGQARLTVTPAGDPLSDSYLPVTVAILRTCDQADCFNMIPPAHPLQLTGPTPAGVTTIFVVEAGDTALPPFTILLEQFCLNCVDADEDGFDGFNEIYCPAGDDCNDDNPDVNPGDVETECDGVDQDCDGSDSCQAIVCVDNDSDGYDNYDPSACPVGRDCNDSNAAISPDAAETDCNGVDEDCDGLDWCPGTGQQCDPCLLTGTCRDDHVCMPGLGGSLGIYAYCAALCDNPNQCPTGSTCVADVYEGHGVCMVLTVAECDDGDLTVNDTCGNPVYSATCPGGCDQDAGVCLESCSGSTPASLDTAISGRLTEGPSGMSSYPGIHDVAGHEEVYSFTAGCTGTAHAVATEMADLEMVLLALVGGCTNAGVVAWDSEDNITHEVEFPVVDGDQYFVVVDTTIQNQEGPFTLLIEVDCGQTGLGHCAPCRFDLQCESGYCDIPGEPSVTDGACVAECTGDGNCPEGSRCVLAGENFVCMPDRSGSCDGQDVWVENTCGITWLLQTCPDGTDCNPVQMACTDGCIDNDQDGYDEFGAQTCPHGNDCNDDDSAINPGATDMRCNEVDEDCSGIDNCSDNAQCESCEGGHCAPGFFCFVDPNFEVPGICLADCTDTMECPTNPAWDLACNSWMSGQGDDSFYCRPEVTRTCSGGDEVVTDGCGRTVQATDCDLACYDDFGCVNYCTATQDHPGCGMTVNGTTVGADDRTDYYYNGSETIDDLTGPEVAYRFTASCTGEIAAILKNAADWLTLVVVKNSSGTCRTSSLVAYDVFLDAPEVVSFGIIEGEEFTLIVDGMDGAAGSFDLTVNCLCGAGCVDNDHDGFIDYHKDDCPSGNDCAGTAPTINPGAVDIECNDIDEDCSGYDKCASHACSVDVEFGNLASPVVDLAGSTAGTLDEMTFYAGTCASPYPRFNVETVYHFKPACTGTFDAAISDPLSDQYDMYLLEGACRADLCTSVAWVELTAEVLADHDYYLVIDGNAATSNTWKLDAAVTCL